VPGSEKSGFQVQVIGKGANQQFDILVGSYGNHIIAELGDIPACGKISRFALITTVDNFNLLIGYLGKTLHIEGGEETTAK